MLTPTLLSFLHIIPKRTLLLNQIKKRILQYLPNLNRHSAECTVSSLTLLNLYSADQPTNLNTQIAKYAEDKVVYSTHTEPNLVPTSCQSHLDDLSQQQVLNSNQYWQVKINENKSVHTVFTPHLTKPPQVHLNNKAIPNSVTA